MARHLRAQSGGNPADHGPVPELANEPASPRQAEDFPDTPAGNRPSGGGGDLTDEQLDDFAARLGVSERDDEPDDEPRDTGGGADSEEAGGTRVRARRRALVVVRVLRRPTARVLLVLGRSTAAAGGRIRSLGERLDRTGRAG